MGQRGGGGTGRGGRGRGGQVLPEQLPQPQVLPQLPQELL